MKRAWAGFALALVFALACAPASAQPLPNQLRIAGLSVAEHQQLLREIARAARRADASEAALRAVAQRLGDLSGGRPNLEALLRALDGQAARVHALEAQLARMQQSGASAGLRQLAAQALAEGRLSDAADLLRESGQSELDGASPALQRAVADFAASAQTDELQFLFSRATPNWERAAELSSDPQERWRYRYAQARAMALPDSDCDDDGCHVLERDGHQEISIGPSGDMLLRSIGLLEQIVLPLAPRETRPLDWAQTQWAIGVRNYRVCERGEGARYCQRALDALTAAAQVYPQNDAKRIELRWRMVMALQYLNAGAFVGDRAALDGLDATLARAQREAESAGDVRLLGDVLARSAQTALARDQNSAAQRRAAAEIYLQAAQAYRRVRGQNAESATHGAVEAYNNAGGLLAASAAGDLAVLARAADAFEQSLALQPSGAGEQRLMAMRQLSTVMLMRRELGEQVSLDRLEQILNEALALTPPGDPGWPYLQNNMGQVIYYRGAALYATMPQQGWEMLQRARPYYEAALTVWTEQSNPQGYRVAAGNLQRVMNWLMPAMIAPRAAGSPN